MSDPFEEIRERFNDNGDLSAIKCAPAYIVSCGGHVYSTKKRGKLTTGRFRKMACSPDKDGYPRVSLCVAGIVLHRKVHRLVAEAFLSEPTPEQVEVRHLDGNPANNNVENLAWGTDIENEADKLRHGRRAIGSKHGMAKLDESRVQTILRRLAGREKARAIASDMDLDERTISRIKRRKIWRHVVAQEVA